MLPSDGKKTFIKQERPDFELSSRKCPVIRVNYYSGILGRTKLLITYPRSVPFLSRERMPETFRSLPDGGKFQVLYLLHDAGGNSLSWLIRSNNIMQTAVSRQLMLVMPELPGTNEDATYLAQELPDFICKTLPVSPRPEDTFLFGTGESSPLALRTAFSASGRFGYVGVTGWSQDSTVEPEFDLIQMAKQAMENHKMPKLFRSCAAGAPEAAVVKRISDALLSLGCDLNVTQLSESCATKYSDKSIADFMNWLLLANGPVIPDKN